MNDLDVFRTLQKAVMAAVAASIMPELPVAYLGRDFTPPDDQKFLEVVIIDNNPIGQFWGEERNYMGLMRLILHWPKNDAGVYPPMEVLQSIGGYFTKDRPLQNLRIYETPTIAAPLDGTGQMLYPASMRYQSFYT